MNISVRGKKRFGICLLVACLVVGNMTGCSFMKKSLEIETGNVSSGSVVMMVGGEQVRYSEVLAYCYFLKCQYENSFGEELWQYKISENETIGDQAKQEIVNMITQLKVINTVAQEQGISLSADEQDEALRQAEDLVRNANAKDKKKYLLSVQEISEIYQENALADKMFYVATDRADTNVSEEEARQAVLDGESGGEGSQTPSDGREPGEDEINQAKEQIIQQRQSDMFIEEYNKWMQDKHVDINQAFWNDFSL